MVCHVYFPFSKMLNPPPPAKILLILLISALKIMAGQWSLTAVTGLLTAEML